MPGLHNHFNERLIERYGISCTEVEYKALCDLKLDNEYPAKHNGEGHRGKASGGTIHFKGKQVHVIKKGKHLITALPPFFLNQKVKHMTKKKVKPFKLIR
jgi:hypothetical protein